MATARSLFVGLGLEERARNPGAAPVAQLALAAGLAALPAIGPRAAIEDDGHVRVVLVVLDHLVEELGLELAGDHAVDHPDLIVRSGLPLARAVRSPALPGHRLRPSH